MRYIYMRESAVIIDNTCLIVYLIFITQCPFGTQMIADDPKNPFMSITQPSKIGKVIHDRDISLDRLSSKSK